MKCSIIPALILWTVSAMAQDSIIVNSAIQYQTIKGWGGTGGQNTQFEGTPPYLITQIINESVNGLGLTGLRYECYQGSYSQTYGMCRSWEWTNDNGSPDTTLWQTFDTTSIDNYMVNLFLPWKNAVVANGEPFTFYESPSWYLSGSTGDIPAFLRYSPGEYSEYLISNLLYLQNKYGLTADYVTMCNEAGNMNVFTPQLVDTMIKTVGPRLAAAGLSTKIQFPECVDAQTSWNYIQALQGDATIWPYISCLSYHLYGTNDPYRADIQTFAQSNGILTAQTEGTGLGIDILYQDLTVGGVSYWDFYGNTDYMPLNTNNTWFTHGAKFWTTGQVIHHVRPGAVRVSATSNDPTVRPMAFVNGGQITTIILNDSANSITQPVTIGGLPAGNYAVGQSTIGGTYSERGVVTVGGSGYLTINVTAQTVVAIYPHPANLAPVATLWAANPTFVDLPTTSVALSSNAIDPELSAVTYNWTVDSFPSGAMVALSNANISNPSATGLTVPGNYVFGVHFSDGTATTTKQVTVQVFANNQPPFISELQSRLPVIITLPVDSTNLRGYAYDPEGDAMTYQYSIVSQPSGASATLVTPTASNTVADNLTVPGDYVFQYSVSDPTHTVSRNITVTVYPLNTAPVISSVSANPATTTLPADSAQLSGITSDPNGDTITHWWLVKSAPLGANPVFSAQGERNTSVSNLSVPGSYIFTLRVVDRTLLTSKDDMVIVNSVLAITFLNFKAFLIAPGTAQLQWQTGTESNSSYFSVERSEDGVNFSAIGQVAAAGNSSSTQAYFYTDNTLSALANLSGTIFYRIAEVDVNGEKTYSSIATVQLTPQKVSLTLVPNPVTDVLNIQVNGASGTADIIIYDMSGRKLMEQYNQVVQGIVFPLNVSGFAAGLYIIQVRINGSTFQQKFIKAAEK